MIQLYIMDPATGEEVKVSNCFWSYYAGAAGVAVQLYCGTDLIDNVNWRNFSSSWLD